MKPLEHDDLTPFEYACALGNLSGLKIALSNQSPDVNKSTYINGLMLAIENQRFDIFRYLISLDSYNAILSRYYHQITRHIEEHSALTLIDELDAKTNIHESPFDIDCSCYPIEQIELPLFEFEITSAEQLSEYEAACIRELSAYYESSLSGQSLESHLQDLKDELAKRYQAQPAMYEEMSLPLDWETFKFINGLVKDDIQSRMLESYYQHPIHTAWRFIASSHAWRLNDTSPKAFDISRHEASTLLILAWFAAKDSNFPHEEMRIQHFFHTLANINRELNRLETQISFDIIDDNYLKHEIKIDNLKWDMPCYPHYLKRRLLSAIIEHPITVVLDLEKLHSQALDFIIEHWMNIIQELSMEQYLLLKYYLEKRHSNPDIKAPAAFYDLYQLFAIDEEKFQHFVHLMQIQWGFRWTNQVDMREKAREFLLNDICEQHAHVFASTLREMYPEVQQTNMQTLSFFNPQVNIDQLDSKSLLKHH